MFAINVEVIDRCNWRLDICTFRSSCYQKSRNGARKVLEELMFVALVVKGKFTQPSKSKKYYVVDNERGCGCPPLIYS